MNNKKKNSRREVASGFLWRFSERLLAQGTAFVVSVILARILQPSLYGAIALVTVFTSILQVFVDSGMGNALIQKKDADNLDFSSVFYFNLATCLVLYALMFAAAPLIASFYGMHELTPVIRVLSLTLVISGVKNIQQAYVSRNLLFRKFFFATLGGTIGAGIIGIWMAYRGFGVWALVAQHLFNTAVDTMILWLTVRWRPERAFSPGRLRGLFSYGWKLLVSSLLDTGYHSLRSLLIGKMYTSEDLAFFNRGQQFPNLIVTNINASIDSVLFPTMSREQDDRKRVRHMTRRAIQISTYIMAPLMIGLAVCSKTLVRLVLTEKWEPCVPFLTIYCIAFMFYPIHTANLNAIKAMGRSDLFLKLEIIKKVISLLVILLTVRISVMAMALSVLGMSVVGQIINSMPNKKLLGYGYFDQVADILPGIAMTVFMGFCIRLLPRLGLGDFATLVLQILVGAVIYLACSAFFRVEALRYLLSAVRAFLRRE
jgi:O-antigen/teichoic acid export membrane protein